MPGDPRLDERAPRHDPQGVVLCDLVEGAPGEHPSDAAALERRVDLGVGEHDVVVDHLVGRETGEDAADVCLPPALVLVAGQHHLLGQVSHASTSVR